MSELIGPDVKVVLFDWDDTLVATIRNKWAQHKHIAQTYYNKVLLDEDLRRHCGKPLREMVTLLYETEDVELAIDRIHTIRHEYPKVLFDETIGVVEHIRGQNKYVGLVTAHSLEGMQYDFDALGVPSALFDYLQTSDDTDYHKPDPRVFEPAIAWLKRLSIQSSEALYVGDSLHDMEGSIGAGLQFAGVESGLVTIEEFRKHGAAAVGNLTELIAA